MITWLLFSTSHLIILFQNCGRKVGLILNSPKHFNNHFNPIKRNFITPACVCNKIPAYNKKPSGGRSTNWFSLSLSPSLCYTLSVSLLSSCSLLCLLTLLTLSLCAFFSCLSTNLVLTSPRLHRPPSCLRYSNATSRLLLWLLCHTTGQWLRQ